MFTPTLLRRNAVPSIRAVPSACLQLQHLTRPRSLNVPWLQRHIHDRGQSTAAKLARQSPYKYPESIIVYRAPFVSTAFHCLTRAACLVVIPIGLMMARIYYLDPTTPNWTVPALAIGSALPFLAISCAYSPTVTQIVLHLPSSARRSREALFGFASSALPSNTRISMRFIRFAPWPKLWTYLYSDLRRLRFIKWPMSNLERIPDAEMERKFSGSGGSGFGAWVVRTYFGRYWVNMTSATRDKSQVPGVWDRVWKGMAFAEEEEKGRKMLSFAEGRAKEKKKVPGMRNREGGAGVRQGVDFGSAVRGAKSQPVRSGRRRT